MEPKFLINSIKAGIFAALLTPLCMSEAIKLNFYFPFVAPKSLYFMAVAEFVFFAWLVLAWGWKQYRLNLKNPVIAAILLFSAVSLAAAIFGADFSASFWSKFERMGGVLMLLHLTGFALAAASVAEKRDWGRIFLASAAVAIIVGLSAVFNQKPETRAGGVIGNDSFLGSYLLFNIFIAFYLFLLNWKKRSRLSYFSAAAFFLLVFCLFFAGTQLFAGIASGHFEYPRHGLLRDIIDSGPRAAKIVFLGGMALFGILGLVFNKNKIIKKITVVALGLAAAAGIFSLSFIFNPNSTVYQNLARDFGKAAIGSRLSVWKIAGNGFLARPVLGWGPENFDLVFARNFNPCLGSTECGTAIWYDRAHNIVLDTLIETGILGLVAYLGIFSAAFWVLWRAYFSKKIGFIAAGIFTALFCAYFLQNLTVFDMVSSYLMFYLCLAFIAGIGEPERQIQKIWPRSLPPMLMLALSVLFAFCFSMFVLGPLSASRDVIRAAAAPYGSAQRIAFSQTALETSPLGKYQVRLFFANQWLSALEDEKSARALNGTQIEETFIFVEKELQKTVRESPLNFQTRLELGRLYNKWSQFAGDKKEEKLNSAFEVLQEAAKISPKNQQVYWELAQTRLYGYKVDEALGFARQARDLYPGNVRAQKTIEQIEKIKADLAAAQ